MKRFFLTLQSLRVSYLIPCILTLLIAWAPLESAASVWDGFAGQFIDGYVYCTTYFNGELIAGGPFESAGAVDGSKFLAKWNGSWVGMNMPGAVTLPGTDPGGVEALAVHQGELFVGGHMRAQNGAPSDNIIRWDGSNWKALNYGVNGPVYALLSTSNGLYVGGEFISAGVVPMKRVARWDGATWNAVGNGLDWAPKALVEYGGEIVACGSVYSASGDLATVAAWNGTTWHQLGSSLGYGYVEDMEVFNGILVAAGDFILPGGSNLAWLDGDTWKPLGGGTDDRAASLTVAMGRLYVGGAFNNVGSGGIAVPASHIAAWNGTTWSALTTGIANQGLSLVKAVLDLSSNGTNVLAGGGFEFAGGLDAPNLAIWDGSAWNNAPSNYGNGLNRQAWSFLTTSDGDLLVGGEFIWAGGQPANRIARWDGTWHTYGEGFNGNVYALAEFNGSIVAAGGFTFSGTQPVNRIARWDGSAWAPLGAGLDGTVSALAVYNGQLVAGGYFTTSGGQQMNRVAQWDGTAWHPMGTGFVNPVQWLVIYGGMLHAANVNGLRRWDGSSWTTIVGYKVLSVTTLGNDLVYYADPGCCEGPVLIRSNGITSTPLPKPATGPLYMADYFGTLVGGGILSSGERGVLALQEPNPWYLLAETIGLSNLPPTDIPVRQLFAHDGSKVKGLFVGGDFIKIGGVPSRGIGLINPEWKPTAVYEDPVHLRLNVSPNPFQHSLAIGLSLEAPQAVEIAVFDIAGRRVATVLNRTFPPGSHEASWDGRDESGNRVRAGIYLISVRQGNQMDSRKVVLID